MGDTVESVVIDLSLPVVTVVFTGSRVERRRQTFLSAFLAAVVELGGRTSTVEIGAHLLPGVPFAIPKSIVKNLENYGLLTESADAVTLTDAGIDALAAGRVPVEEKGTWTVDVALTGSEVCVVRCGRIEVSDYQLRQARRKRMEEGAPAGPRKGVEVPSDLFGSWHRVVGSGGTEIRLDRTSGQIASAPSEARLGLRLARGGGARDGLRVWAKISGGDDHEYWPVGSFAEWITGVEKSVIEMISTSPVDLDSLPDSEVVAGVRSVSLVDLDLGNGVVCSRVAAEGLAVIPPVTELDRWFDRLVAARLTPGLGMSSVADLAREVASGLGLGKSRVPSDPAELLTRVRGDIERRGGRFTASWWNASTPTDWAMP